MKRLFIAACAVAGALDCAAEGPVSDDDVRMRDVFTSSLPKTQPQGTARFTVRPHFGDFNRYDYLRVPLGLRYGVTDRWQAETELEGYFSHGLGDVSFGKSAGFSNARVATKYHFRRQFVPTWETAVGVEYSQPVGNPPPQVTDGLKHTSSFVTFAHRLDRRPNMRVFWNLTSDFVEKTRIVGEDRKNDLRDNNLGVSGGLVWDRKTLHYTFESSVQTTRITGKNHRDLFTVRPGVVWDVPRRYTFNAKGQWQIGAGLRASYGHDGTDVGLSVKMRLNFDLKRWFKRNQS